MSVTERQLSLERKKVEVDEKRLERQLELKERELVLRERELMLKEKEIEQKKIDRFSGYIKQQALLQEQIFILQQHISNIEMQNAEILRLIKSLHQKQRK